MLSRFATSVTQIGHARARSLLSPCGRRPGVTVTTSARVLGIELRNEDLADSDPKQKNLSLIRADVTGRGLQPAEGYLAALSRPGMPDLLSRWRATMHLPHALMASATAMV